jgi:hypothetical protein
MATRSAHAGSAPPTAEERIRETDLTAEQLEERRKWQKREEKVQGVIRTTVSSITTLKRPIESVQQEQETEQVSLCCQRHRRKAKYRTSSRGMRHMKSAGTVTKQDTSLETVGHRRMMQTTRSSSYLSQGFEGLSQRDISEKMQAHTRVMQ